MHEAWLALFVFIAHAVETTTGFGGTIIALALGVRVAPIETLVVALVMVGVTQAVWILARSWRHVEMGLLTRTVIPCAAAGAVLGVLLGSSLPGEVLRKVLAVFVIAVASVELYRLLRTRPQAPLSPWPARLVLGAGGVFHGLFATGGPAVVYWASRMIHDRRRFRATLAALWFVLGIGLLVAARFTGTLDATALRLAAHALPGLVLGIALGEVLHRRLPERAFRGAVQGLLLVVGLTLLT